MRRTSCKLLARLVLKGIVSQREWTSDDQVAEACGGLKLELSADIASPLHHYVHGLKEHIQECIFIAQKLHAQNLFTKDCFEKEFTALCGPQLSQTVLELSSFGWSASSATRFSSQNTSQPNPCRVRCFEDLLARYWARIAEDTPMMFPVRGSVSQPFHARREKSG